jgi:two-component system, chemotaxis family, sensor kinase CheA
MSDEMEEITAEFITESEETLDQVDTLFVELEAKGTDKEIVNKLFRSVHTIKGAAGFLGFQSIVDVAHNAESIMKKVRDGDLEVSRPLIDVILKSVDMLRLLLKHIRDKDGVQEDISLLVKELGNALAAVQKPGAMAAAAKSPEPAKQAAAEAHQKKAPDEALGVQMEQEPAAPRKETEQIEATMDKKESLQTLRVEVGKIDKVMDLTGEVVLVRNRLLNIMNRLEQKYTDDHEVESLNEAVSFLDLITSDMQLGVMRMRMQPIEKVFGKFPRLVRDISTTLGKQVELKVFGEDTEVDRSVIEHIGDPMVHIIRNAIDHGLETPEERRAQGKSEQGTITIRASQKGNQIVIEISDDGKGVNVEKVKKKAVSKGIITAEEAARMTDESAVNLIFLPGFSTAEVATELSGRGVGMDVVKTNISKLNGAVEISTAKGAGSTFTIRLPLTVAIIQTLMVRSGASRYAIPLAPVEETLMVSKENISEVAGAEALTVRGRVYPLFDLTGILGDTREKGLLYKYAVVVSVGDRRFCIGVDELFGQEEAVIKSVDGINTSSSHILGATITGDGKVVFIIDLASLSKSIAVLAAA